MVGLCLKEARVATANKLRQYGINTADLEADYIISHVCGIDRVHLLVEGGRILTSDEVNKITDIIKMRTAGVPLQYLIGEWEFYSMPFLVGEGVLIPRPDTEVLVDRAIQILKGSGDQPVIADLCSGSGCIAIAIKKNMPSVRVFAVERSPKAMHYLIKNKAKNNVDIEEVLADVCDESTLEDMPNLDMVVANPPYLNKDDIENLQREVAFEPREALYGSSDGLRFYREITAIWTRRIKHGGILMYEIGQGQHEEVLQIMLDNGIVDIEFEEDVNGIIRLIYGRINRK